MKEIYPKEKNPHKYLGKSNSQLNLIARGLFLHKISGFCDCCTWLKLIFFFFKSCCSSPPPLRLNNNYKLYFFLLLTMCLTFRFLRRTWDIHLSSELCPLNFYLRDRNFHSSSALAKLYLYKI